MTEFFENPDFINEYNKLYIHQKNEVLAIMKEMKEQNNELTINSFIGILHKIKNPSTSNSNYSAFLYMHSVEIWNKYIFNNKKNFKLLIPQPYQKIVY